MADITSVGANDDSYQVRPQKSSSGISHLTGSPIVKTVMGYFTGGVGGAAGGLTSGTKAGDAMGVYNQTQQKQNGQAQNASYGYNNSGYGVDDMTRRYQNSLGDYNFYNSSGG